MIEAQLPSQAFGQIGFYGDDFTGGTANLAGFQRAGLDAIMFLRTPSIDDVSRYAADMQVIGIAGIARSLAPEAMEREIRPAFLLFAALGLQIAQYKVCSTFDSSPSRGNLAVVIDVARRVLSASAPVPIVPACPASGRYTLFGNHFATYKGEAYRIDRHPVMSIHPSTPMREGDLRRHLQVQGVEKSCLVPVTVLREGADAAKERLATAGGEFCDAAIFDGLDARDLTSTASLILEMSKDQPMFVIAAQDFAYALGKLIASPVSDDEDRASGALDDVGRIVAFSGSASSLNGEQIRHALEHGWAGIRLDPTTLSEDTSRAAVIEALATQADYHLAQGRSVVIYTADGNGDVSVGDIDFAESVGTAFGQLGTTLVRRHRLRRLVFAGGDTSSYAMRALGGVALRVVGSRESGGNMCRLVSEDSSLDGLEVLLKGGQVGSPDIFPQTLIGAQWTTQRPAAHA